MDIPKHQWSPGSSAKCDHCGATVADCMKPCVAPTTPPALVAKRGKEKPDG